MYTEKYYYLRNKNNVPMITVCLLKDEENNVARGISICSERDVVCKKRGRRIAKVRAEHAMKTKAYSLQIGRLETETIVADVEDINTQYLPTWYKSSYNLNVADYEKKILKMN